MRMISPCASLLLSLLANFSHAMVVDGTVWVGDHSGFTVDDAYRFLRGEVSKQTNETSIVETMSAHRVDGACYYYITVLWGTKDTNGLFRAKGRQCFEVRGAENVIPHRWDAITNELQVSSFSYPEIRSCLNAFGIDVRKVHWVERDCKASTNETWGVWLTPSKGDFSIRTEEIKEVLETVRRHPNHPSGGVLPEIKELREKMKRTRKKEFLAKYGEIKNDSHVGMSAADFEAMLGKVRIDYEPEPTTGYLWFKPLKLGMKTRCGMCHVGDRRFLFVWQACGANGEWRVVKDIEFSRELLDTLLTF